MTISRRVDVLPKAVDLNLFGEEKLSKRGKVRGYNFFKNGYVHKVEFEVLKDCQVAVQAKCFRSMRKSDLPHSLNVCFQQNGFIAESKCSCVAGYVGLHIFSFVPIYRLLN